MKTISLKVPEDLDLKLTAVAAKRRESKSALIRTALDHLVKSSDAITPNSCLDLAKDLMGTVEGPSDLSYNNRHLKESRKPFCEKRITRACPAR
jgi:Arc/MetJ-type ribon-helix-helix transcriptional regulator